MNELPAHSPRVRMAPDARRESILDTAQALFLARGWEAVTVADVLDAAGISKGGFYHHFSAKEDLLTAIVDRMTEESLLAANAFRRREAGDALARLNAFISGSVQWNADNAAEVRYFAEVLTKPGNDILFQRIFQSTTATVQPVLEQLISQGVEEGVFDVADIRLAAELLLGLGQGRLSVLANAFASASAGDLANATKQLDARMQAEAVTCDRILGLSTGSVVLSHPVHYRKILSAMTGCD